MINAREAAPSVEPRPLRPSALWPFDGPSGGLLRRIQRHGCAKERLERLLVDLVALADIDGAPHVTFEAGIEEPCRVLERRTLGEGQLHDRLVGLPGADDAVVLPHRNPSPLPLLDHV